MATFMLGKLMDSNKITWKGKHGNQTYQELEAMFYESDYSNFSTHPELDDENQQLEKVFLIPHGYCLKLPDTMALRGEVRSSKKVMFLVADPDMVNKFQLREMTNANAYLGPTDHNGHFDISGYQLEYSFHDAHIQDHMTCTDYQKLGTTFGNCIEKELKNKFLALFGCLPPWYTKHIGSGLVCEDDKDIRIPNIKLFEQMHRDIDEAVWGRDSEVFKECLKPCHSLSVHLRQTFLKTNDINYASLNFVALNELKISQEVFEYDKFNLIVDLGSAMGLWLGLRAITIVDYVLMLCHKVFTNKIPKIVEVKPVTSSN